jgi:hypothetical protein
MNRVFCKKHYKLLKQSSKKEWLMCIWGCIYDKKTKKEVRLI